MLTDVKDRIERFGLSDSTMNKRKPVAMGIRILAMFILALIGYTIFEIHFPSEKIGTPYYLLLARFTILSFGFFGTIIYYIKWENKWADRHANSEFQLQQFHLDINRSSWVIESCLEWQKETSTNIPKELIASLTSNLFSNNECDNEMVTHPADELASALLGSASRLKLKVNDNEIEFDKPGKISNKAIGIKKPAEE